MNSNVALQSRNIATATAAAAVCLFGGQNLLNEPEPQKTAWGAIVRFNELSASPSAVQMFNTSDFAKATADFANAITTAFNALASRQQRLEPALALAMAAEAWDLYETE